MTIATAPAAERLAAFRTHHRIEVDHSPDWNRCDTCGIRVYQVVTRRWQHDMNEVRQLEQEVARVADVISIASAPLRRFETVVIEDHGAYVVTADLEDEPPAHDHFDIWDGSESCPRCAYETLRAEG